MKQENIISILIFVSALFLIVIGIGLSVFTQTVTKYRYVYGFNVPYQETIQPYIGVGILIIITGVGCLIFAFVRLRIFEKV